MLSVSFKFKKNIFFDDHVYKSMKEVNIYKQPTARDIPGLNGHMLEISLITF